MTLQAEFLVDRRRLRRRLTLWRFAAVLLALLLPAVLLVQQQDVATALGLKSHIARVTVTGIIQDDRTRTKLLDDIASASEVAAVILRINSPGGTTTGGESLYVSVRRLTEKKPVVAVFSTVAASSAYLVGLASDHIVARGNTITGSVGVILQWAEVTQLLDKIGVKVEEVKSGPLKATPSPFEPLDEAGRELAKEMVEDAQKWFVGLVAERRGVDPDAVPGLKDGRIYSGRQALDLKLIDAIGGEKEAQAWLEDKRGIEKNLEIVDWREKDKDRFSWWQLLFGAAAKLAGFPAARLDSALDPVRALDRVRLDGLVSLWQPPNN